MCIPWVRGGVETGDSHREEDKIVTDAALGLWRTQVFILNISSSGPLLREKHNSFFFYDST